MDEPHADPSAVALYFVSQIASEKVKVVLSGEGSVSYTHLYPGLLFQGSGPLGRVRNIPPNLSVFGSRPGFFHLNQGASLDDLGAGIAIIDVYKRQSLI